ncbi:hypothetical protein [Komagataeibacter intermedius]|uniref:Uncharacterized protein n=1 Tax=Komagataeibacter intermedius NRIC 0521 TaxID=1307934 RepID=A0ABQ0PGS2_9PROT|nr:hypothetical protein [Komagataeibacter intermedius]GAN86396.1 hypothetical protein Gain_0027_071 [Komagataeibacter intermedius TF2]GBQ68098.1 hypothetical protein AA0521_1154 [Komagataeibacter intermedius NRIC 0521]
MRSREEQIADLTNLFGEEGTFSFVDDRDAATKHIIEAERRAERRVQAEIARDSERLDWIERHRATQAVHLDGSGWHIVPDGESCGVDGETFRAAVDAAMKAEREAQG